MAVTTFEYIKTIGTPFAYLLSQYSEDFLCYYILQLICILSYVSPSKKYTPRHKNRIKIFGSVSLKLDWETMTFSVRSMKWRGLKISHFHTKTEMKWIQTVFSFKVKNLLPAPHEICDNSIIHLPGKNNHFFFSWKFST